MRTIRTKVYSFNELNEEAQNVAIQDFLNSDRDFFYMDESIDSIKLGLNFFNFKMGNRRSILCDYAKHFNADVTSCWPLDEVESLSGVRLFKFLQNNYRNVWEEDCPFTIYCADYNFLEPIKLFMSRPTNLTFKELMEECCYSVFKLMESDWDYHNSEDFAREELSESDKEFLVTGKEFNL